MNGDELAELLRDCPVLYHMAERGSWPSIRRHGLLSTSALLDLYGVTGAARTALEAERRPEGVLLEEPGLGRATIRDQKPMDDAGLRRCLQDGLTPEDWYRLLNGKVFLWPSRERLSRLLSAKPYRLLEHDVLELDAASLVREYIDRITLSPINSGTTRPFPVPRGRDTFLPVAEYPYAAWRARRRRGERVVEVTVEGGIAEVERFTFRVTRMRGDEVIETLFERPGAGQAAP
ncbi:DUF7002 family protein [Roseomonas sp. WA12]